MRYFLGYHFSKDLKKELRKEHIKEPEYLKDLFQEVKKGKGNKIGGKLVKIRVAKKSHGKSGGYRNIVFIETNKWAIAIYIFSKNEKENISNKELTAFKTLADYYETMTEEIIEKHIKRGVLKEFKNV